MRSLISEAWGVDMTWHGMMGRIHVRQHTHIHIYMANSAAFSSFPKMGVTGLVTFATSDWEMTNDDSNTPSAAKIYLNCRFVATPDYQK